MRLGVWGSAVCLLAVSVGYLVYDPVRSGGPLGAVADPVPTFGPTVWKRKCVGLEWTRERPDGEWRMCLGFVVGPRLVYRSLADVTAWTAPSIPAELSAVVIIQDLTKDWHSREMAGKPFKRAEVLTWRRDNSGEEALVAVEEVAGDWYLIRVYKRLKPASGAWSAYHMYDSSFDGYAHFERSPTDRDLEQFVRGSWWDGADARAFWGAWGINQDAWRWATGAAAPDSLRNEVERLKVYRQPVR